MAVTLNQYTPRSLTTAVNTMISPKRWLLDTIFGAPQIHPTETIDIEIILSNRKLAPFVTPVEGAIVMTKLGRSMRSVDTARMAVKKPLSARELGANIYPATNIYVGSGDIMDYQRRKIAQEQLDIRQSMERTVEWMAAQALSGVLTVNQENIQFEIDFLMPDDNRPELAGVDMWDDYTNSDPIADIEEWKRVVQLATGMTPTMAVAGYSVIDHLRNHTKVRNILDNRRMEMGMIAPTTKNDYFGRLAGVDIYQYNESYTDTNGNVQYLIGSDKFIIWAPNSDFRLHYAAIHNINPSGGFELVAAPYFSKSWTENDPSVLWLYVESKPLPVVHRPESVIYATVL